MKKTLLATIIGILLTPLIAFALNVTVPQAPGANYVLLSTTTGMYNYVFNNFLSTTTASSLYVPYLDTTLTASQAVITNASSSLITIPYSYANTDNSIVERDSAGNAAFNNVIGTVTQISSSNQTIAMTYGSSQGQEIYGTASTTFDLPDSTYLYQGEQFQFNNNSTGNIVIYEHDGTTLLGIIPSMEFAVAICDNNSTVNGEWDIHYWIPSLNNFLSTTSAASIYLPLSASTSLAYIPSASSGLYVPYTGATGGVNLNNQYLSNVATLSVGTTSTSSIVMIQGTTTQPLLNVMASSSASALYVAANGNVGIGTTTMGSLGSSMNSDQLFINSTGNAFVDINTTRSGAQSGIGFDNTSASNNQIFRIMYQPSSAGNYLSIYPYGLGVTYGLNMLSSNGNIGIGNITPQQALTLTSGDNFATNLPTPATPTATASTTGGGTFLATSTWVFKITASDGVGNTTASAYSATTTTTTSTSSVVVSWTAITGASSYQIWYATSSFLTAGNYFTATTNSYNFATTSGSISGTLPTATTAYVNKISASGNSWLLGGNVGIGTSTPNAILQVTGSGTNAIANFASSSNQSVLYIAANGNVGIGTSTPSSPLTINYDSGSISAPDISIGTGGNADNYISFSGQRGYMGYLSASSTMIIQGGYAGGTPKGISFEVGNVSGTSANWNGGIVAMTILPTSGNVGIGTISPSTALYVVGTTTTSGLLITKGVSYSGQSVCYMSDGSLGHQTAAQLTAGQCIGN